MVEINIDEWSANDVRDGVVKEAICRTRKCREGDNLQLHTGQGTKQCRKLRDAVCTAVRLIEIWENKVYIRDEELNYPAALYHPLALTKFAKETGFSSWDQMKRFVGINHGGLPFDGFLIRWE